MDSVSDNLPPDWNGITSIIPYGLGWEASRCIDKLIDDFDIPFIIDNDSAKHDKKYRNIPILPWSVARLRLDKRKIIITTRYRRYYEIMKDLQNYGMREYHDFCSIKEFVPEWYWKNKHQCCMFTVDVTVSAQCNFKCKNCNMFMPYHKHKVSLSLEELKKSIDIFFDVVDYVFYIGFIGGEPLLCKNLAEFIEYIVDNYTNKVSNFTVHTNGSIIPHKNLLNVLRKYNISVAISDYGEHSPSRNKMCDTIEVLKDNGIYCDVRSTLLWKDMGFPLHPNNFPNDKIKKHMKSCSADWRGLNDGKLYFCNIAWSAEAGGLVELERDDYVDLSDLALEGLQGKHKLLQHVMGNFDKGYMSFCKVCGGCGADNPNNVVPGVQMP